MIDKILLVNENEVVVYFIDQPTLVVITTDGTALELALEALCITSKAA